MSKISKTALNLYPTSLHTIHHLQQLCEHAGVQVNLCDFIHPYKAGVDIEVISREDELKVFRWVREQIDCPELGLYVGQAMHTASYGILGYLMLVSENLRMSLQNTQCFSLQLGSYFGSALVEVDQMAQWHCTQYSADADLYEFNIDLCLSSYWRMIQTVLTSSEAPMAVHLKRSNVAYLSAYEAVFHCPIVLGSDFDGLVFPQEYLDKTLNFYNNTSYQMAFQHCQSIESALFKSAQKQWSEKVKQLLEQDLNRFMLIEDVAESCFVSQRTLRRYLKHENTTFQMLLDGVRSEKALQFLQQDNVRLQQIAETLGYSEVAAFRLAFKRWTGQSLATYRRQNLS